MTDSALPSRPGSFVRDGAVLRPRPNVRSGWGPMLMGRYLSGLVAWGAEPFGGDEFQPARLTVDMFRAAPLGETEVNARVVRDGRRIKVVDVDVVIDGRVCCRGSVVFVQRTESPSGGAWYPAEPELPDPEAIEMVRRNGWKPAWDQRMFGPWGTTRDDRGVWIAEDQEFVEGEPVSPFVQAALAADNVNGLINANEEGLSYINADLTMTLARLPRGRWTCLVPVSRALDSGVSVGAIDLYDGDGRIGQVTTVSLADERNVARQLARLAEGQTPGE